MPTTLARRRLTALFVPVVLFAALALSMTQRADAEPAKHGGATAGVLAQEANRPTPGVDAPKVAPRARAQHTHHATAKAKPKAKAKAAGPLKPVKANDVKAKHGAPKPARKHAPSAKPVPKLSAKA